MKKIKYVIIFIFLIACIASIFVFTNGKDMKLKRTLESSSYSYLPKEAKNFIEDIYNETGEIVYTEKNKKENVPYLNPAYIEYLTLSEEEKQEVDEIPITYVVDAKYDDIDSTSLPSSYDLRNVNNKNFVTPIRNQASLGICWAFATSEQAESYLLVQSDTTYTSSAKIFSARQLDYAASTDGITSYTNTKFGFRNLTQGGNYLAASTLLANGIGLVAESKIPFSESTATRNLQDVLNYNNSEYELMESESLFSQDYVEGTTDYDNFINKVKYNVMTYGGAYVSTQAPGETCSSRNSDGKTIINIDSSCTQATDHAMHVIGWDDDYQYSYCKKDTFHSNNVSNCSSSNLVTGQGAWIIRNSWGPDYQYVYLAYESDLSSFYTTKELRSMSSKTWENVYNDAADPSKYGVSITATSQYTRDYSTPEKIEQIKFHTYSQGGHYNISFYSDSNDYENVKSVTADGIGYVTVDVSNLNIVITDSTFQMKVKSDNGGFILLNTLSVFTSNIDNIPVIEYDQYVSNYNTNGYEYYLYAKTKNIDSNTAITFQLYDDKGNNKSSKMSYSANKVAINNANVSMTINGSLPEGIYTLKSYCNDNEYESKIILTSNYELSGSGTQQDPYLISTEADLRKISLHMDAYYRLQNDITLQNDWVPIGIESNPFTGFFNGQDHKISNINITGTYKNAGFFGAVKSATIKNLILENATIKGTGDSGILLGTVTGDQGYGTGEDAPTSTVTISTISIQGGSVIAYAGSAGSLIGSIMPTNTAYRGHHKYELNKIYSSATISGTSASGLIGTFDSPNNSSYMTILTMEDIQNMGTIDLNPLINDNYVPVQNTHSSFIGNITNYSTISFSTYISNPLFRGFTYSNSGLYGHKSSNSTILINSGYNLRDGNTSAKDIRDIEDYNSSWNIGTVWEHRTFENIPRIAILKNATFNYTFLNNNITLEKNTSIKISDMVNDPNLARVEVTNISDNSVVSVTPLIDATSNQIYDLQINAIGPGVATIHIISQYDGYEKDIVVTSTVTMEDFELSETEIEIDVGAQYEVEAIYTPSDTTEDRTITWTNTDSNVATINSNNIITGLNPGTTVFTGVLTNGKQVQLTVTVHELIHLTSFVVSNSSISLNPNDSWELAVQYNPYNTTDNKSVTWTSSDESVATVVDGVITGIGEGQATITGSLENGMEITTQVNIVNEQIVRKKGDLNHNGNLDINDVIIALRKIFGYLPADSKDLSIGDVTGDEEIGLADVIKMLKYYFGYIDSLD